MYLRFASTPSPRSERGLVHFLRLVIMLGVWCLVGLAGLIAFALLTR